MPLNFYYDPWATEAQAIWIDPGTYSVSAGLLSAGGAQGALRVIQWSPSGAVVADQILATGGGNGSWVTLQNTFPTLPGVCSVSIRLMNNGVGTFNWDSVSLVKLIAIP